LITQTVNKKYFAKAYNKICPAYLSQNRFTIIYGGSGSAKSFTLYQLLLIELFNNKHQSDIIIFRKIGSTIYNSVFQGLKKLAKDWQLNDILEFKKTPLEIVNKENDRRIILSGVDDPEKLKSIVNIRIALLEEATEFTKDDFLEINRRLRGIPNIKIILVFNPISHLHWIKKHFFDNEMIRKDTDIVKCSYMDNQFLTKEDIEQLENLKYIDENDYKIYCLGEWGILTERLIFKNWSVVDTIPANAKRILSGMDFGFNPDPTVLVDCYILGDSVYFDERIYKQNLTNIELGTGFSIEEELNTIGFPKSQMIVADSAEPKSIMELRMKGFNILAVQKPGIFDSLKMMKSYKIHLTSRSKNGINEMENYVHKIDKEGNILPEPLGGNDHFIDCCRYILSQKDRLW